MKIKILGGIALLAITAVITANINISLRGTKQISEITMASLEAWAGDDENNEILKTYECENGSGSKKVCENQIDSECEYSKESNDCGGGVLATGNGYTPTSLCATQGHNYQIGGDYKQCSRCNARVPVNPDSGNNSGNGSGNNNGSGNSNNYNYPPPHTHTWSLIYIRYITITKSEYIWKCSGCTSTVSTNTNLMPSRTLGL
jgi:hypothetical protein